MKINGNFNCEWDSLNYKNRYSFGCHECWHGVIKLIGQSGIKKQNFVHQTKLSKTIEKILSMIDSEAATN